MDRREEDEDGNFFKEGDYEERGIDFQLQRRSIWVSFLLSSPISSLFEQD